VSGSVHAIRIDGDTGAIDVDLPVPEIAVDWAGPYGGAVDSAGDFWFHSRDAGLPHPLVHVAADGGSYEIIAVPDPVNPYGITVDSNNRIWLAGYEGGIGRYDPVLGTWQTVVGFTGLGIQEDAEGRMWMAIYPWATTGVHAFDVNTMAHVTTIDMTGTAPSSRGISIDFDGYVWMVDQDASAWRIDPASQTWQSYSGLTGPYTYSDMTGWGLSLVTPG
jgi:sugar lactone lactonase YvrE